MKWIRFSGFSSFTLSVENRLKIDELIRMINFKSNFNLISLLIIKWNNFSRSLLCPLGEIKGSITQEFKRNICIIFGSFRRTGTWISPLEISVLKSHPANSTEINWRANDLRISTDKDARFVTITKFLLALL